MFIQRPKGTYDLLPDKAFKRTFIEAKLREILSDFNYDEIRTPAFEKTVLFKRSIGEETDIVSKEMYTLSDDEFTLKPEMTAPVIRAYLENSLFNEAPLKKLFYICNMFRRERPQAGRFREFSQFGAEAIGSSNSLMDIEMISLGELILKKFGIENFYIRINTIGTMEERKVFLAELIKYLEKNKSELSQDSKRRLVINPLRILDSKDEGDIKILEGSPVLYDFLTEESKNNFEKILKGLDDLSVKYTVDCKLVRGIDYYTNTVFEFISDSLGAKNSLLGGGRYDVLVQQLGGKPTPAIGFAAGIERFITILDANNFFYPTPKQLQLYIITIGDESRKFASGLLQSLRNDGVKCDTDYLGRNVKSQMKEANKLNAKYVLVIGDEEIKSGKGKLKRMSDGAEIEIEDFNNIKNML